MALGVRLTLAVAEFELDWVSLGVAEALGVCDGVRVLLGVRVALGLSVAEIDGVVLGVVVGLPVCDGVGLGDGEQTSLRAKMRAEPYPAGSTDQLAPPSTDTSGASDSAKPGAGVLSPSMSAHKTAPSGEDHVTQKARDRSVSRAKPTPTRETNVYAGAAPSATSTDAVRTRAPGAVNTVSEVASKTETERRTARPAPPASAARPSTTCVRAYAPGPHAGSASGRKRAIPRHVVPDIVRFFASTSAVATRYVLSSTTPSGNPDELGERVAVRLCDCEGDDGGPRATAATTVRAAKTTRLIHSLNPSEMPVLRQSLSDLRQAKRLEIAQLSAIHPQGTNVRKDRHATHASGVAGRQPRSHQETPACVCGGADGEENGVSDPL